MDMESVFWPPISGDVVTAAVALAASLSGPTSHAAYLAALPGPVFRDGGVVIHTTTLAIHSAPVAFVAYDATIHAGSSAAPSHFDVNGAEFRLPQEELQ